MSPMDFPSYFHLDALNSLATKCVHSLCFPVNSLYSKMTSLSLPSLYDINILINYNQRMSSKAPFRFIELLYKRFRNSNQYLSGKKKFLLDINSRQTIIDYITRERIIVSPNFVIQLLKDGGLYNFDLWKLSEINEFTFEEVEEILQQMCLVSQSFQKLSIGGSLWIYNFRLTNGPLKKLLCKSGSLPKLRVLKIQQISFEIDFISLLYSCPNLQKLEIAQPSLKNCEILKMAFHMSSNLPPVCQSLRHIVFPSSVKEEGIMHFLAYFPKITHLRCRPFEQLLDLLDDSSTNLSTNQYLVHKASNVLKNLKSLQVTHPMSCDMIDRLLTACPKLEDLSLKLQEGMSLTKLITNAPFLTKLELHNSPSMPIKFIEHVAPILEGCGKRLTSLSLDYFDHIDLTICARFCPNLETFSAQWFSTITVQTRLHRLFKIDKSFSKLTHLRLHPRPPHSLPVEICTFILNNAFLLRYIELYCCSELTDDTIYEINSKNPLVHLQTFIMRHGNNVTNEALFKLVSQASSSNNLVFHDCGLVPPITKEDM